MNKLKFITVALLCAMAFGACVDDKESASVEKMREAKSAFMLAQADYQKAQAEAAKILAEAEKKKAENEAARIASEEKIALMKAETERLLAEAQAAKDRAEAARLQAEADRIQAEIAQIQAQTEAAAKKLAIELQKLQLEYEMQQARAEVERQALNMRLDSLKMAEKMDPQLVQLYDQYQQALSRIAPYRVNIANEQMSLLGLQLSINGSVKSQADYLTGDVKSKQEALEQLNKELKALEEVAGLADAALTAKIKELTNANKQIKTQEDAALAKMVENYADYSKLMDAYGKAYVAFGDAGVIIDGGILSTGEYIQGAVQDSLEAEQALTDAKNGINWATNQIKWGFTVVDEYNNVIPDENGYSMNIPGFPEFPTYSGNVTAEIEKYKADITKAETEVEKAVQAKEDSIRLVADNTVGKMIDARKQAVAGLKAENEDLQKEIDAAQAALPTAQTALQNLENDYITKQNDYNTKLGELNALKAQYPTPTPAQQQQIAAKQAEVNAAKTAMDTAKALRDAKQKEIDAYTKTIADNLQKINENSVKISQAENVDIPALENRQTTLVYSIQDGGSCDYAIDYANRKLEACKAKYVALKEMYEKALSATDQASEIAKAEAALELAKTTLADARKALEEAGVALEAADAAVEASEYAKAQAEFNDLAVKYSNNESLIAVYRNINGNEPGTTSDLIQDKREAIAQAETDLAEAEKALNDFEMLSDDEKAEAYADYAYGQLQIMKEHIDTLTKEMNELQAEADRIKALIDAHLAAASEE